MTDQTPVERAAQAIRDDWQEGMKATEMDERDAQTAYEAINTDELAYLIAVCHGFDPSELARAIKNWLTGKDQQ